MRHALQMYLKRDMPPAMRKYYADLERGLARGDCDQGLRCTATAKGKCIQWVLDASCPQLHWSQHPLRCGSGNHEGQTCVAAASENRQQCIGWQPELLCPTPTRTTLLQDGQLSYLRQQLQQALQEYARLKAAGSNVHQRDGGPCPDNLDNLRTTECQLHLMQSVDACIQRRSSLNLEFRELLVQLQRLDAAIQSRLKELQLSNGLPLESEQPVYAELIRHLNLPGKHKSQVGHEQAQQEMERFRAHCVRALSPVPFESHN